jgi:hypothetical protein
VRMMKCGVRVDESDCPNYRIPPKHVFWGYFPSPTTT